MRIPDTLTSLVDQGVIEEVLRPLMSGKEAQIYLVISGGTECVAKIYKEAQNRTFKHRADYTEGRKVRNTRDQRAINKRSQHGRDQDEAAWRSTEVDMIYRLRAAGVAVPAPHNFIDGVLVMELVTDANGEPAARLGELDFTPEEATAIYEGLIRDVVRMLCAGVVHGDLSDFNVLVGANGPVIIDFPQAVDPSKNQNARKLLLRDVENLHRFYTRFVPNARRKPYAEEMWALYESNQLTPESVLKGQYRGSQRKANTDSLLEFLGEVNDDERRRRTALGLSTGGVPSESRSERPRSGAAPAHSHAPRAHAGRGSPAPHAAPAQAHNPRAAAPRRVEVIVSPAAARPRKPPFTAPLRNGAPPAARGNAQPAQPAQHVRAPAPRPSAAAADGRHSAREQPARASQAVQPGPPAGAEPAPGTAPRRRRRRRSKSAHAASPPQQREGAGRSPQREGAANPPPRPAQPEPRVRTRRGPQGDAT